MKKRIAVFLLLIVMIVGLFPVSAFAADDFKVVVSMEGLTLGQGLYFEPKAYSLSEINTLVNGSYTSDTLTAGIATKAFLIDNNIDYTMTGSWDSDAYLSGIKNVDTGVLNIPEVISQNGGPSNDKNDGNEDEYLGEFDYNSESGWMITVNDFMIDVGCGQWLFTDSQNQSKYLSNLGNTYVVRWQFTLSGYGADLGADTGWGMTPYFTAAKKAPLYAAYAESDSTEKKAEAKPVMEDLTATQDAVNAALSALTVSDENDKTVTVKIAPNTVNASFYLGDNANTALSSSKVSDKGVNGNYHEYVLSAAPGDYSYRAADGETDLGGMSFTVGSDAEQSMTLVRTNYYTTNTAVSAIGAYDIEIMPGSMRNVVTGTQYIDGSNRVVTPTLLWANGNAMLYNWKITLNGDPANNYGVAMSINNTFANTLSAVQNKTFTLANLVDYSIIAPSDAEVKMFNQLKNFNVEEIKQTSQENAEGGNIKHIFRTVESANLTYRASMSGKITRAGYMGTKEKTEPVVISFGENENPKTTENIMDSAAMQSRIESSTFVNVNRQNDLALNEGDTFRLRSYRGAWEIINSDTANIMIEPDFCYNIISGREHISMTPASNRCTGNAGDNWMDIKGVSAGTAIVEVSYDAVIIGGSGTSYTGQYGATDPNRKSLVVIQVGEDTGVLDVKAKGHTNAWDTELDTVYTVEDTASFSFTATLDGAEPTVSLSTDKGNTWTNVYANNGYFEATGLVSGSNILKFTANGKTAYQVVRAAKIKYSVVNNSRNTNEIKQGDKLTVTFDGTYMAIPKMSGIYNPSAHTLVYGSTKSASKQCGGYDLTSKCAITLTLGDTVGEQIFEDGYISATMFCANDPMGAHRSLTDAGVGANFSAVSLTFNCGVYPTLKFNVSENAECEHKWSETGEVTVAHTAAKAGEMRYVCEKCGEYKFVATSKGACSKFAVEVPAVVPTVTRDGHEAGTWCSECHKVLSGMETIPAAGYQMILEDTLDQLAKTVTEPAFGTGAGEWSVLTLARGGYYQTGDAYFENYFDRVIKTVAETAASVDLNGALHKTKSTENSRLVIALSAIGKNPRNVGGVDVLGAYDANGFNWIKKQGINGPIFALIALDSSKYQITDTTLRQQCVEFILDKELEGGGWALSGTAADPDITSMALQALVNYKNYKSETSGKTVSAAANRAFDALSAIQQENGGFSSWGSVNSESIAQVIVACTSWGIDPDKDSRFIQNGHSALEALLSFYVAEGKGFAHVLESGGGYTGGEVNGMATDQAGYALVAYDRFVKGKTALYDMTDVKREVSADELCAAITLPENIENKAGTTFNAIISLNGFLKDYRLIDSIVTIPEGVKVNGVTIGSRISGGEVSYFVEKETGKLRIVYFDANKGTVLTDSGDEYPVELMTINCELENELAADELTLAVTGMTFKQTSESETQVIVVTDTATDTAKLVEGISFAVATLYTGDDIDLISKEKTAVAIYVTGVAKGTKIEYNDGTNSVALKYNPAISDKIGISSYLSIIASDISLDGFLCEENYTITEESASSVSFGDVNADAVINAQDALNIVNFWLRSINAPTDDEILRANVTGDSRINTFDSLGIVEYFVDGDEFAIVNLAATAGNGVNE